MKRLLLKVLGYALCIGLPVVAVIDQFGYHVQEATWTQWLPSSGLTLVMLILCFKPVLNMVMGLLERLCSKNAAWKMWMIVTIVMAAICKIGYPMVIVGIYGTVGNVVGGALIQRAEKPANKQGG